jgi:hypothetical protein
MEDVQQSTPTPDDDGDSLFVPAALMATTPPLVFELFPEQTPTPSSPILTPGKVESAEEVVLPFVQKLRELEKLANDEMTSWDSKYLGLISQELTRSTSAGMKRKGTMPISEQFLHILLILV